jgi:hypothetical protein
VTGDITGPPCSWGYKYRDLALQVGGVSDETIKYGLNYEGLGPEIDSELYKLQTRPLVRQGAPQPEDRKCPTALKI